MSSSVIINLLASASATQVMFSLMMRSTALPASRRLLRSPEFSSKPRIFCSRTSSVKVSRNPMTSLRKPSMFSAWRRSIEAAMVSRLCTARACACSKLTTRLSLGLALKSLTMMRSAAIALLKSRLAPASVAECLTVSKAVPTSLSPEI